jgi:hypothetical protein
MTKIFSIFLALMTIFLALTANTFAISSISAGQGHTVMVAMPGGTLWGWGTNGSGQFGDGTVTRRLFPVQVLPDSTWAEVSAGWFYTLGLKSDGVGEGTRPVSLAIIPQQTNSPPCKWGPIVPGGSVGRIKSRSCVEIERDPMGMGNQRLWSAWRQHHNKQTLPCAGGYG